MEKKEYIKQIEEKGCAVLQQAPIEFFDDEEFIEDAEYANEIYTEKRMREENDIKMKNFVKKVARIRFDDVFQSRMEQRKNHWREKILNNFFEIRKLPFDLVGDEDYVKQLREDNEEALKVAQKMGELQKFGKIEDVKKQARNNFELGILKRKKERKTFWQEKIVEDEQNIYYMPFDLICDCDFRKEVEKKFEGDRLEKVNGLYKARIGDMKILQREKEIEDSYTRKK